MNGKLSLAINFMSSKDFEETRTMYTNSDNIEFLLVMKQIKSLKNFLNIF